MQCRDMNSAVIFKINVTLSFFFSHGKKKTIGDAYRNDGLELNSYCYVLRVLIPVHYAKQANLQYISTLRRPLSLLPSPRFICLSPPSSPPLPLPLLSAIFHLSFSLGFFRRYLEICTSQLDFHFPVDVWRLAGRDKPNIENALKLTHGYHTNWKSTFENPNMFWLLVGFFVPHAWNENGFVPCLLKRRSLIHADYFN